MSTAQRRVYVASSWRNPRQPEVVAALRAAGFGVYDFRHPKPGDDGFNWREIDPDWERWSPSTFRDALSHPIARRGFRSDFDAMAWADAGVLLMPCGRSAHLEAGYFVGAGKPLYVLLADGEPELMLAMATRLCLDLDELIYHLGRSSEFTGSNAVRPAG
jgi:nucleoside 2-deoxyribosyltransferase